VTPEEKLWSTVISQAVEDYKDALHILNKETGDHEKALRTISRIEREFKSPWAEDFCGFVNLHPDQILNRLQELKTKSGLNQKDLKKNRRFLH